MVYMCPLCSIDPSSHSLMKIKVTESKVFYYSCPSEAKLYFDCDGIIKHYDGFLNEIPKNKQWVWIFDSKNFNFKHFSQANIGIQLAKLISNKFSHNLLKIIIIHPTIYISLTYKMIKPFLDSNTIEKIIFDENENENENFYNIEYIIDKYF
jgi:hypothetical protein